MKRCAAMGKTISGHKFIIFSGAFLIAMYLIFLNPYVDVRGFNAHDPVGYLGRAPLLWQGFGYGEQFAEVFMPVTVQPPIFSLLLAPVAGIFGINFFVLKLYMLVFSGFFGLALYRFFAYFCDSPSKAMPATLLMMSSPVIFGLSHRILADVPLFVFVVSGLLIVDQYLKKPSSIFSKQLAFSAIAMSGAYLLKQTGVALFAGAWALFLHPSYRNKLVFKKLLILSALALIPIVAWHAWSKTVPDDLWYWTTPAARDYFWKNPKTAVDGYIPFLDFVIRVRHNLVWGIFNNIAAVFIAPFYFLEGSAAGFLLAFPVVIWLVWEWVKSFVKQPSVLEGFVFFSLLLLVPKYLGMASRYVAIIWPALVVYGFRGISIVPQKIKTPFVYSLILLAMGSTLIVAWDQQKNPYGSKTLSDYVSIAAQAKQILPEAEVCKAPLPLHWQLLTGHKCQYKGQTLVTYFLALSDPSKDITSYQDIEFDALRDAQAIGNFWQQDASRTKKILQNDTFALFKVVNHGN